MFLPPHLQKPNSKKPLVSAPPASPPPGEQGRKMSPVIRPKATASPVIKEARIKPTGAASAALKVERILKVKSIKLKTPYGIKALAVHTPVNSQTVKRKHVATSGKAGIKSLSKSTVRNLLAVQKQAALKLKARATTLTPCLRPTELKAARAKVIFTKAKLKPRGTAAAASRAPASRVTTPGTPSRTTAAGKEVRATPLPNSSPSKKADLGAAADGPPRRAVKRLAKGENGWLRPAELPSTPSLSRARGASNTAVASTKLSARGSTQDASPSKAVAVLSDDPNTPRQLRSGRTPAPPFPPSDRKRKQPEAVSTSAPARHDDNPTRATPSKPSSSSSSSNHRHEAATTFVKGSSEAINSRSRCNSHSNIAEGVVSDCRADDAAQQEPSSNSNSPAAAMAAEDRKGVE
eukprot:191027-Pyramimonas_sp.AAC.1